MKGWKQKNNHWCKYFYICWNQMLKKTNVENKKQITDVNTFKLVFRYAWNYRSE